MPHSRTFAIAHPHRRRISVLAIAALIAGAFVAGTGTAAAVGSADLGSLGAGSGVGGVDPTLGRSVTITQDNLSITREVVGDNTGTVGDTITYRTTVAAVDGPAREITRISEDRAYVYAYSEVNTYMDFTSAEITHTTTSGDRVTDTVALTPMPDRDAVGSWRVDAANTVVYESTYTFKAEVSGMPQNGWDENPNQIRNGVAIDVTDLGTVVGPSGVEVRCVGCTSIPSTDENIFDVIDGFFEGS